MIELLKFKIDYKRRYLPIKYLGTQKERSQNVPRCTTVAQRGKNGGL
jgi:hypothetical protein